MRFVGEVTLTKGTHLNNSEVTSDRSAGDNLVNSGHRNHTSRGRDLVFQGLSSVTKSRTVPV